MFTKVFDLSHYNKWNMLIWFLLAFQAGAINAGAFIGCHRFVSHVTGFATLVGTEIARSRFDAALGMATVPLFFLVGAMISAYFVDKRVAAHQKPQYTFLVFTIAVLMMVASFGGLNGWFGAFNTPTETEPNYSLLAILCLTCGIQNASTSAASKSVVRTTHLSGLTTDLGIGLMRIFAQGQTSKIKYEETRATGMRVGIIGSFIAGSTVAAFVFLSYGFCGYFIPAVISSGLLLIDLKDRIHSRMSTRGLT
jgi:uncharacterized membrane protein YoaK (UPF0700 family)